MRRRLFLAALAVVLVLPVLSTPPTGSQPREQTKPTAPKPTRSPTPAEVQECRKAKAELDRRQLIENILRTNPGLDSAAVARQFGPSDPTLPNVSREELETRIGKITVPPAESEGTWILSSVIGENDSMNVPNPAAQAAPPPTTGRPIVRDQSIIDAGRSVVAIVDRKALRKVGNAWVLKVDSLKQVGGLTPLCRSDLDYGCPATKVAGTGFLVGADVIATAGHVAYMHDGSYRQFLESVYFLFDYAWGPGNVADTVFTDDKVYKGRSVLARRLDVEDDFALIRLDREVTGRVPAKCRSEGQVSSQDRVYLIGHPNGVPQRQVPAAPVLDNTACSYFLAGLDSWPGNSGSPVFNAVSHEVEGILVRDIKAYEELCGCATTAKWRPQLGRPGVDVVRATEFIGLLSQPDSVLVRFKARHCEMAVVIPALGESHVRLDEWPATVRPVQLAGASARGDTELHLPVPPVSRECVGHRRC